MTTNQLPIIRSGERATFKRCPKKWYWAWRRGLVPRAKQFGALDLGTWVHHALARWYGPGKQRRGHLGGIFLASARLDMRTAKSNGAPEHVMDKAEELAALGEAMMNAYQDHYGNDDALDIVGAEVPLEFTFTDSRPPYRPVAIHRLTPDAVFRAADGGIWLLETKTAVAIRTEHLAIDDQARPYGVMAERALRNVKLIEKGETFRGILYNYLRKALPDGRKQDAQGHYLNQNGSVSKRQPPPMFIRKPIVLSRKAKLITLGRVQRETIAITLATQDLRKRDILPELIPKTPHWSCPRTCDYFSMCVAEEEGTDIQDMERTLFVRRNPYEQDETTDEPIGFEMG